MKSYNTAKMIAKSYMNKYGIYPGYRSKYCKLKDFDNVMSCFNKNCEKFEECRIMFMLIFAYVTYTKMSYKEYHTIAIDLCTRTTGYTLSEILEESISNNNSVKGDINGLA